MCRVGISNMQRKLNNTRKREREIQNNRRDAQTQTYRNTKTQRCNGRDIGRYREIQRRIDVDDIMVMRTVAMKEEKRL